MLSKVFIRGSPVRANQIKKELDVALDLYKNRPGSCNHYLSLLKAFSRSKDLDSVKRVQSHLEKHNLHLSNRLGEHIVLALSRCGALNEAVVLLSKLPCRTSFSWTAVISSFTDSGCYKDALDMHQHMVSDGVDPDPYTFVSLFKACGNLPDLDLGKTLHAQARHKGFTSDVFICSALVTMYGRAGEIQNAEDAFLELSNHNVVSWTAMLSAYMEQGYLNKVLLSYRQMVMEGVNTNQGTFVIVIQACGALADNDRNLRNQALELGQALHADACRKNLSSDSFVGTTLINMYGKCGSISDSECAIQSLRQCTLPSFNAMLAAYVETGQGEKALQFYTHMKHFTKNDPDQQTFASLVHACNIMAEKDEQKVMALMIGQAIFEEIRAKGLVTDLFVGTAVVSMFAKCGALNEAELVFSGLCERNTVSWNAMISALAEKGEIEKTVQVYKEMINTGVRLDDVTFVHVMQACGETGSIDIFRHVHFDCVSVGYDQNPLLASTMIHVYGRCADMEDVGGMFDVLPNMEIVSWNACMAGYGGEGNVASCIRIFLEMYQTGFDANDATFTSLLSACNHSGHVHEGTQYFVFMCTYYCISRQLNHNVIMIDLFSRAGDFNRVSTFLEALKDHDNLGICLSLLGACRRHGNFELAKQVFQFSVDLQPNHGAAYVLMSNIYADSILEDE